jgi:hypothetical protein
LLKAGVPFAAGILAVARSLLLLAFLLLLGCHKLVSDCIAHVHFHGHQFSTDIRSATFLESGRDDGHRIPPCNTFFFAGDGIGFIQLGYACGSPFFLFSPADTFFKKSLKIFHLVVPCLDFGSLHGKWKDTVPVLDN